MKNHHNDIMKEKTAKQNTAVMLSMTAIMAAVIVYRIVLIATYLSKYIDDDQALMWYGTVLASHGGIREPHFLGQMYGSMLESIAAVPLYKIGVPLEWALPLATFAIWFFPFVLLAMLCRKKMPVMSFTIMLCALLCHWNYDILTNIPRAFISGFPLAFLGLVLITEESEPKAWKLFAGTLLMGLAYLNTVTSIAVSALGVLYLVIYKRERLKRGRPAILSGLAVSLGILYYCNNVFYKLNPDYWVFGDREKLNLSLSVFIDNLKKLPEILCSFSVVNFIDVPVSFYLYCIAAVFLIFMLIKQKDYKFLFVVFCSVRGSLAFMMVSRTTRYDTSLWYSATRLYLYFPYVVITVLFLYVLKSGDEFVWDINLPVPNKKIINGKFICSIFVLFAAAVSVYKIYRFTGSVINLDMLYQRSTVIEICCVEDIYRVAEELRDITRENDTDIVISICHATDNRDNSVYGIYSHKYLDYAVSAINYDEYTEYRTFFDRRTDVYFKLKDRILDNEKVTFVKFENNEIAEIYTEVLDNTDVITYVEESSGLYRPQIRIEAS